MFIPGFSGSVNAKIQTVSTEIQSLCFIFVPAEIILSFSLAFLDKGKCLTISVPFPILNYVDYSLNPWRIKKAAIFIVSLCDTFC